MKNKQFDKNLKDNLQQYTSKVDTTALWDNIESDVDAINEANKKKKYFYFLYLCFGIILIAGLGYFANLTSLNTSVNQTILNKNSTKINSNTQDKIFNNKNTSLKINEKENATFEKLSSKNYYSKNKTNTRQLIHHSNSTEIQETYNNINTSLRKPVYQKEKQIEQHTVSITPSKPLTTTPLLETPTLFLEGSLFDKDLNFIKSDLAEDDESQYRNRNFQFSIEIQGGINNTTRNFERNETDVNDYLTLRRQSEETLETINFSALINATHQETGLGLTTGVQWTSITEKFEFQGSTFETDTIENGLFGYIINPNGDTIPVYDQVISTIEIINNKRSYNKYRLVEIPILLGYHWQNDDWSIGVEAGVFANLMLKASGNIISPNRQIIDIEKEQAQVFRSNIGLSYYFGLSTRYYLTDHLQITASPSFRYFSNSFTLSDYPLNQRYYLLGGNIGMRYSF